MSNGDVTGEQPTYVGSAGRVYFGWRIVAALFLCTFALFGVSVYGFIILTTALSAEYGWSAARAGSLVSAMWIVAPISLLAAPVIRLLGPWRLLAAGFLVQAVVMFGLAFVSEFWQLYGLRVMMGIGKVSMVVAMPVIVTRWFARRFATAIAIVWAGGSAGGMLLSPLIERLIFLFGWRSTTLAIGAGILGCIAIVYALTRGAPEASSGARRPADASAKGAGAGGEPSNERVLSVHEALGVVYWPAAIAMFAAVLGTGVFAIAILSQQPAIMSAAGVPSSAAALILGLLAAAAMAGSASIGWLLDRFPAVVSCLLVALLVYLGLFCFHLIQGHSSVGLGAFAAFAVGYAIGAGEVLWMDLTRRQFGNPAYATTYGGWYLALQVGYGIGGGLAGLAFERMSPSQFLLCVGFLYLPTALFSVWRPGIRQ